MNVLAEPPIGETAPLDRPPVQGRFVFGAQRSSTGSVRK